jgi:hypothetical protein
VTPVDPAPPEKYGKLFHTVLPSPILSFPVSVSYANSPAKSTRLEPTEAQFAAVSCRSCNRFGTVGHCDIVLWRAYISRRTTEVDLFVEPKRTACVHVVAYDIVGISVGPDDW